MKFRSINPDELENRDRHRYLLSSIAPRPIAFASTIDKDGNVNLSPFSYFNVFSSNPPVLVFSPARSGRDNSTKHTYDNVKEVPEVVVNIVNYPIVEQMSLASSGYEKGVNEFVKAGLTQAESETVRPPRVQESPVSFECTVDQVIELGDEGGAGNLIIARVRRIHIREEYLRENGTIDPLKMDQVARMGESWYCRANPESMFELQKPGGKLGIGVDRLPEEIQHSSVLSGNDLGRLGGLDALPSDEEIESAVQSDDVRKALNEYSDDPDALTGELHRIGKRLVGEGKIAEALAVMMAGDGGR